MPVSTLHRLAVVSCVLSGLALSPGGRQALAQESAIGLSIDQVQPRNDRRYLVRNSRNVRFQRSSRD